jgi:adenosylcobinamide-GDP ribazoletransferase
LACILILNIALIHGLERSLAFTALVLLPTAGRVGSLIGAGISRYARSGEGLGKSFIEYCGSVEIAIGLPLYFAFFYITGGIDWLPAAVFPVFTALIAVTCFSRKIGGTTGDILGAVCEINQTAFLLSIYILKAFGLGLGG